MSIKYLKFTKNSKDEQNRRNEFETKLINVVFQDFPFVRTFSVENKNCRKLIF